jgi:hypothetical protein
MHDGGCVAVDASGGRLAGVHGNRAPEAAESQAWIARRRER